MQPLTTIPDFQPDNPGEQSSSPATQWLDRLEARFKPGSRVKVIVSHKAAKPNMMGEVVRTRRSRNGVAVMVRWDGDGSRTSEVPSSKLVFVDETKESDRRADKRPGAPRKQPSKRKPGKTRAKSKTANMPDQKSLEMAWAIANASSARKYDDEVAALVGLLFPDGIPNHPGVLSALRDWMDATERLLRLAEN